VWRIMLIAPEPVANDEGGSDDVLTPIKVGSANPTPRPIGSMPKVAARKLGSRPGTTDHQTCPRANETIPAAQTAAVPNRAMSWRENRSETTGISSGPGAIARPIFRADQPQIICSHNTIDNKSAPKAAVPGAIASAAPVNGRMRNRSGSIKGSDDRRQCATNHPRKMTVAAQAAMMPGECQPQSFILTIAKTRDATPAVTTSAAPKWGCELLWPGTLGSFRQPTTRAISPIGRLTRKIQRQLAVTRTPPMSGPSAAATPPAAVHVRTAPLRPSGGKADSSSPSDVGVMSAAAGACTTRKTTSISVSVAAAHAADAAVKAPIPARKLRLRG